MSRNNAQQSGSQYYQSQIAKSNLPQCESGLRAHTAKLPQKHKRSKARLMLKPEQGKAGMPAGSEATLRLVNNVSAKAQTAREEKRSEHGRRC